jgi:hypothetical protein
MKITEIDWNSFDYEENFHKLDLLVMTVKKPADAWLGDDFVHVTIVRHECVPQVGGLQPILVYGDQFAKMLDKHFQPSVSEEFRQADSGLRWGLSMHLARGGAYEGHHRKTDLLPFGGKK